MNDIFGEDQQGEPEAKPEPIQKTERAQKEEPAEVEQTEAAPPAAEGEANVPLKALEAERSKRREWKEEALKSQGQNQELRRQLEAFQRGQPMPEEPVDPVRQALSIAQNERLDTSEMLVRERFGDQVVDDAFEKFQDAVQKDPSLYQKVMGQKHPWGALVKEMQKTALLSEIGEDPTAYKERIRAELRAELETNTTPKAPLPQSLAGARSSGARSAGPWTGPPSLDDILKR